MQQFNHAELSLLMRGLVHVAAQPQDAQETAALAALGDRLASLLSPSCDRTSPPPVCKACGSDNVSVDAGCRWSSDASAWVVASIYDDAHCDDCGDECELTYPAPAAAA